MHFRNVNDAWWSQVWLIVTGPTAGECVRLGDITGWLIQEVFCQDLGQWSFLENAVS